MDSGCPSITPGCVAIAADAKAESPAGDLHEVGGFVEEVGDGAIFHLLLVSYISKSGPTTLGVDWHTCMGLDVDQDVFYPIEVVLDGDADSGGNVVRGTDG